MSMSRTLHWPQSVSREDDLRQQALDLGLEETQDRSAGWLCGYARSDYLSDAATQLREVMHSLHSSSDRSDTLHFQTMEQHCCEEFAAVVRAGALQYVRDGKRNKFLRKVSEQSDKFCEIALYYQNAFDVLSNAGDYTSAIWGAVKLLLIYRVNSSTLKSEVMKHLRNIGVHMTELSAFVYVPRTRFMQQTITEIYSHLLSFLSEALKFYTESRTRRALRTLSQPFDVRFRPIIEKIDSSIQTVHRTIQVLVLHTTDELRKQVAQIRNAVDTGTQDILSVVTGGQLTILQGQTEIIDQLKALQVVWGDRRCEAVGLWDKRMSEKLMKEHLRHKVSDSTMTVAELDQAQLLCQFEEMIPALRHVRETDDARQAKYKPATIMAHEEDSPSVSNLQWSFKSHAGARLWGVKDQSHFLQIEGYQENTRFAWTTRFSLDIQRLVFTIENGMVLTFFAEKEKFITTPSLILQSFIQQAILLNMEKFRPPVCCRQAVSIDRLRDCGDDFIKLWSFFAVCLDIVQPSCIFVVLDNMDAMLTSSEKDDLDLFAQFLGGLAHSRAPFCKILTTVRMNSLKPKTVELSQCPCSGDECPHCSLLRIARVHRAGSDLISQRRKHRLSIVGTFIEPIDDPILAQLAAEDLEEQNERDDIDSLFDETDSVNQAETSTTPERQIDLDVSEQDSLLDDTDHALSDIFYSDSETDRKVSRKGLPPLKRTQNDHAKSADTDEDDIIGEIFCSENEDLGLSDVDQDSDHAQSSLTGPTQTGPSHVDNDLDYDEDFNNL